MAIDPTKDKELFIRLADGDEAAFRQIYDSYRSPFYAAAYKITRSAELAEETVQELFVALWKKRTQVGAAHNPLGYLVTMLHNSVYSQFRKMATERQLRKRLEVATGEAEELPVDELLLAKESQELLQNVISRLPPQQQLVYRLAKQEGLSREEIAQKLNISTNTVRNHLAAAVEFVRENVSKGISSIIWAIILDQL